MAHWGGGLPFYGLMKKEGPEVLRRVYFDTAASPYLYRPADLPPGGRNGGPGEDHLRQRLPPAARQPLPERDGEAGLPEDWREMILGKNLARLMGV